MDLFQEFIDVVEGLNKAGLDYALCGGLALSLYGHPRATRDIDLLIRGQDCQEVKRALARLGYDIEALPMRFHEGTDREITLHLLTKTAGRDTLTIDLITVEPHLEAAWNDRLRFEVEGVEIKAVSPQGLKRMKRHSGRAQDLADLEKLEELGDE